MEKFYKGWLDNTTFLVESDQVKINEDTYCVAWAELHTDEDNAIIYGENYYETETHNFIDVVYESDGFDVIGKAVQKDDFDKIIKKEIENL